MNAYLRMLMKRTITIFCVSFFFAGLSCAQVVGDSPLKHVKLAGYVGNRIDDCILHRIKGQSVEELIEPFHYKNEINRWQSEFWGKWVQGAITAYRYTRDAELYSQIKTSVDLLLETQEPNGYIGNYGPEHQLEQWDVWGRKYTMLGLISWYDLSGDGKALEAACRVLDHLMTQVGPGLTDIVATGNYVGMPSTSVLEPVMYLYNRTRNPRYLDFAEYIVRQWEKEDGPQLIGKAIADVPVAFRFPHPEVWFSRHNGQKAYEMMSCYEGLLELYKVTGNPLYLSAVEKTVSHIVQEEINIAGSGSSVECWYSGKERQTLPTYHTMETCVTFTWMQLCNRLLQLTGNSLYADYMERTIYNALLGSMKRDGSQIAKYTPLEGWRVEGEKQCGMNINCCNANGPRAFAMIPFFAYQAKGSRIYVNLYNESEAELILPGKNTVRLTQRTDFPVDGQVTIEVNPSKNADFAIALRIPAWSKRTSVSVNGREEKELLAGSYCVIGRKWKKGDKIVIGLDLRARVVEQNQMQAIVRGPILLARDSRLKDGFVDETVVVQDKDGYVELTPAEIPDFAWMAFTAPMVAGTDLEGNGTPRPIKLCDFASAGNTWDKAERYRVWLPKTLNVTLAPYKPYNE